MVEAAAKGAEARGGGGGGGGEDEFDQESSGARPIRFIFFFCFFVGCFCSCH